MVYYIKFRESRIQGCRDAGIQGCRDTEIQGFRVVANKYVYADRYGFPVFQLVMVVSFHGDPQKMFQASSLIDNITR